ncbi:hypothetical protein CA54_41470 [Symmachiella macrocystis]|uniref:Uncharacterized protein n=1 Tax=Symmachiella macrocystis TaxID=2527985 RepID=A0A5C6BAA8_9PLAN|nr:hypothetical protein [Symmachiella macrocystis]TWU08908.1 hypothetical protein CA54_41470 [Symmachiella macrocystis]
MARPEGSRNTLIAITYDTIGEMAGGIVGDTARQYTQRGQFDPRSLDSLLKWVNARRTAKGLPLIGIPDQAYTEQSAPNLPDSGYNPLTGEFEP